MKKCINCNSEVHEDARFCLYCMTSFEEKEKIIVPRNKKRGFVFWGGILLLASLSICIGAIFLMQSSENENSLSGEMTFSNQESFLNNFSAESEVEEGFDRSDFFESSQAAESVVSSSSSELSVEQENSQETGASQEQENSQGTESLQESDKSKATEASREPERSETQASSREEEVSKSEDPSQEKESSQEEDSASKIMYGTYGNMTVERIDSTLIFSGTGKLIFFEESPWYLDRYEVEEIIIKDGITGIEENAFKGFGSAKRVTIPSTVTVIGNSAFCDCCSLEEITIPDSVTSIGDNAFMWCNFSLTDIVIPKSVTSIGKGAFDGCAALTNVTILGSITAIESDTFAHCYQLSNITIPESVTSIGAKAFYLCSSLTEVTIGSNVAEIGEGAFAGCENLTSVTFSETNGWYSNSQELDVTNPKNNAKYLSEKSYNEVYRLE